MYLPNIQAMPPNSSSRADETAKSAASPLTAQPLATKG